VLPLAEGECEAYWREVALDIADGVRDLLVAREHGQLVGSVQLAPCGKPNQPHRAEVQKLLVLASARGRGIGAALMRALEARSGEAGRWLLTLDTRSGSVAEYCYRRWGWTACGAIPRYALDPDRTLADCTFFYKALDSRAGATA
jgi:GNAT superfamily N-acetyltransferase